MQTQIVLKTIQIRDICDDFGIPDKHLRDLNILDTVFGFDFREVNQFQFVRDIYSKQTNTNIHWSILLCVLLKLKKVPKLYF